MRIIHPGDRGEDVHDVQQRLVAAGHSIDPRELGGAFGPSTGAAVRAFQQRRGIPADGLVGSETWAHLVEAGYSLGDRTLYLRLPAFRGDDVLSLQLRLNALGFDAGREDGIFGQRTDAAVREFQRNVGSEPDGIVGHETIAGLDRLRRRDEGEPEGRSRALVREGEAVLTMRSWLAGATIAIDPGHGPDEPGATGPGGTVEADVTLALAEALAQELAARGARPTLLRDPGADPPQSVRTKAANELGATLCLALHVNSGEPGAEGATCFYFGTERTHSPAGRRLAELIQEELTGRLGLLDGRVHPLAVEVLRETRMPAVQVEPCFITNPREERLLADPSFRGGVARAIASGIERFLGAADPSHRAGDGATSDA